jgi:hypothetical protein
VNLQRVDTVSEEPKEEDLSIWTVYAHPRDYPDHFVARRFVLATATPTSDVLIASTLDDLRAMLPPGFYRMPRMPGDDVNIIEVWI